MTHHYHLLITQVYYRRHFTICYSFNGCTGWHCYVYPVTRFFHLCSRYFMDSKRSYNYTTTHRPW